MDDLIKRLEEATEGNQHLDRLVLDEIHSKPKPPKVWGYIPDYTTSIDCALALVPKGSEWTVSNYRGSRPGEAGIAIGGNWRFPSDAEAATPALALCIAALKARETQEG